MLHRLDAGVEVWFENQGVHISLWNNLDVHLEELFIQKWLLYLNFKFTAVGFAAQGISHHISFARGVRNSHFVVGYCLDPSLLAEIQVGLSKQVLQSLVVCVDLTTITDEV